LHFIETPRTARPFQLEAKKSAILKPPARWARINGMRENAVDGTPVKDNATAAILGAIAGYLVQRHWPEIEAIVRMLTG
jgi:hypothetical protein